MSSCLVLPIYILYTIILILLNKKKNTKIITLQIDTNSHSVGLFIFAVTIIIIIYSARHYIIRRGRFAGKVPTQLCIYIQEHFFLSQNFRLCFYSIYWITLYVYFSCLLIESGIDQIKWRIYRQNIIQNWKWYILCAVLMKRMQ